MEASYCDICGKRARVGRISYAVHVRYRNESDASQVSGGLLKRDETGAATDICSACVEVVTNSLNNAWAFGVGDLYQSLGEPPESLSLMLPGEELVEG